MIFKFILFLLGAILAIPILALIILAFKLPITISGIGYLLASILLIAGLILFPWQPKSSWAILAGVVSIAIIAGARIFLGSLNSTSDLSMITLPQEKQTRWISYILDEQDTIIFGEELFHRIGGDSNNEHTDVASALDLIYSEMRTEGVFPSPIAGTYLNSQNPIHFDATIVEPKNQNQIEFGVIFLHGYMGNVSAQCWVIAQPVAKLGGTTICPSTVWQGYWWEPQGQAILQDTFVYLRSKGIRQIYIGGYSNGGFGLGRLASQFKDEKELSGFIFIDGFANSTDVRDIGLPVLIIQGLLDERVPASDAHQFAADLGDLATYVELDADHFLIMKQPDLVMNTLAQWLEDRQSVK